MANRFSMASLTSEAGETSNTWMAATLAAHDFPLNAQRTLTSVKGDGFKGVSVTWHFEPTCPAGNSVKEAMKAYADPKRAAIHPDCTLVICKGASARYMDLVRFTRGEGHFSLPSFALPPYCETPDTRKAAAMEALGHPIKGARFADGRCHFMFAQASAPDFAIWDEPRIWERLPDAAISLLWCMFDQHKGMVDFVKGKPQFAAVAHQGRLAMVGKDMSPSAIDGLDRLLHRR